MKKKDYKRRLSDTEKTELMNWIKRGVKMVMIRRKFNIAPCTYYYYYDKVKKTNPEFSTSYQRYLENLIRTQ